MTQEDVRRAHVLGRLEHVLAPTAIAVVGASERAEAPGARVVRYLLAHDYAGAIYPVTRREGDIQGLAAYPSLDALPQVPQLVVVAVAVEGVPDILSDAAKLGVDGVVVFSAGADPVLAERMRAISDESGVLLLGPNCTGFVNVPGRVAASFNSVLELNPLEPGHLSVVTQSGGVGSVLFNRLRDAGVGLRFMVSTGDELSVGMGDVLAYLAEDEGTAAVVAYVESFRIADSFLAGAEALRMAGKRLIVLKAGNFPVAQIAAQTHTNALATDGKVAGAVLDEVGATRVTTVRQAVDAAAIDAALRRAHATATVASSIAFIGTSGGGCVLAADAAARAHLSVVQFADETNVALAKMLPSFASVANPLDVTAGLLNEPRRLADVAQTVADDPHVELLVIVGLISTRVLAESIVNAIAQIRSEGGPPVIVALESGSVVEDVYSDLRIPGVAVIEGLDDSMQALAALAAARPPAIWPETGPTPLEDGPSAFDHIGPGARDLPEDESLEVLLRAGLPVQVATPIATAEDLDDAALSYPLALKISAEAVFHKQRHRLLALDLATPAAAKAARDELLRAAAAAGVEDWRLVAQPMAPRGIELILGLRRDPVFGSLVVLGVGGTLVEDVGRVAVARAVAAQRDPDGLVARAALTDAVSPAARQALADTIRRFSAFVLRSGERLRECEVNPLIVLSDGGLAIVDAKICVDA